MTWPNLLHQCILCLCRRYGFPNQAAIDAGETGTKCRGEEHDVTLVWSVTSGKRMIMSNGRQLLVDTSKTTVIEHSWTDIRGNNIRLKAHSTAPMSSASESRQYDLFINGKSYFTLPRSYEIGLKGPTDDRIPGVITDKDYSSQMQSPHSPERERRLAPHTREEVGFMSYNWATYLFSCIIYLLIFTMLMLTNYLLIFQTS